MKFRTLVAALIVAVTLSMVTPLSANGAPVTRTYPLHTGIVATTFWVGEIFDPNASDGSQMLSTYDENWYAHFGGCDGVIKGTGVKACSTEKRTASNGFFPTSMTPKENPFYLDLPYDDLNNRNGFRNRAANIPWANDPGYVGNAKNQNFSYMKNRWVQITKGTNTCYGQIQDAGPGKYYDPNYVFGTSRPLNRRYNGAGMDVSPALNGCLGFKDLDGANDIVSWRWVEFQDVAPGPWLKIITTSQVDN